MTDYLNYEPEDFARDDFSIHWVRSTDIAAETFWQNWHRNVPFQRPAVEAAAPAVLITQNLPEPEISDTELGALRRIDFQPDRPDGTGTADDLALLRPNGRQRPALAGYW